MAEDPSISLNAEAVMAASTSTADVSNFAPRGSTKIEGSRMVVMSSQILNSTHVDAGMATGYTDHIFH
ncbi:hypothetical protein Scep_009306 [Stephania cephalantha]|uniref:Uncharacterized protein n=1 Tax=Stephania cephalantha TaxID=152367 RepID=A0AAP0JTW6_9MAGN